MTLLLHITDNINEQKTGVYYSALDLGASLIQLDYDSTKNY